MAFARTHGSPKVNSPSLAWALGAILLGTVLGAPVRAQRPNSGAETNVAVKLASVAPPVVSSISPSTGPTTGGTVITITGSNFVVGATAVQFGANSATGVSCSSATTCTATSPAGSGTVNVRLTTASGTSTDSSASAFTYTAGPATNCSTFSGPTTFGAGSTPISVAIGDFDGDGIDDLAVANQGAGDNVSVLLGTATGTFGAATNFAAGMSPGGVAIGDFNGDGKLDLAVANLSSANVSILLGTGTGSFGAATNFAAGSVPEKVVLGDFNGDGKLDLAVANLGSDSVSIRLGTGTGIFGAATNFATGSGPVSVAIRDFNGDGKLDLAVANFHSGDVSILLNAGCTSGAANLFLLTPCRVLDTRGGAPVPANGVMNLVVTGKCGVATGATAIAANVTVVSPSAEGFVTLYPGPANTVKPVVSTINFTVGRTLANNARITLGVDGSINIFNAAGTPLDFLIDVAGYFK